MEESANNFMAISVANEAGSGIPRPAVPGRVYSHEQGTVLAIELGLDGSVNSIALFSPISYTDCMVPLSGYESAARTGGFPATHWSKLAAAKGDVSAARRDALNFLLIRYWKPAYFYVRRFGHGEEESKDLVQEFFSAALATELFAKADPARGRFRNLLLKSLKNFLANAQRAAGAKKRHPAEGFVSIHELATEEGPAVVPKDTVTPDELFHRTWLRELTLRVLKTLENECLATGKQLHFEFFRRRIVEPILEGANPPSLRELAEQKRLNEKDVDNRVITARRAYQRLLREEIRLYASSDEEVAEEIQDIFRFLSGS
jgi:DNA-directed RNA polymerase specialized sigma24 family protein